MHHQENGLHIEDSGLLTERISTSGQKLIKGILRIPRKPELL